MKLNSESNYVKGWNWKKKYSIKIKRKKKTIGVDQAWPVKLVTWIMRL
jgi:hypothetical protein